MTIALIRTPYEPIIGLNAQGLTGKLYFGLESLDPVDNPKAVYWDSAGLQPAEQPIDVQGGYAMRDGTPAKLYIDGRFSILATTTGGVQVWRSVSEGPDDTAAGAGAYETRFYMIDACVGSDIIDAQTYKRAVAYATNFAGCGGGCESVDATTICSITKNGVAWGTLTYHTDGTVTPASLASSPAVALDDVIRVVAPASANNLTGARFTFAGALITE